MYVAARRAAALAEEKEGAGEGGDAGEGGEEGSPLEGSQTVIPVAVWLPSYGTDPYYPSRRIRRITERVYFKVTSLLLVGGVDPCLPFCIELESWLY